VALQLVASDAQTHVEVITELHDQQRRRLEDQALDLLAAGVSRTRAKLRDALRVKNQRVGEALESLERYGRLRHTPPGLAVPQLTLRRGNGSRRITLTT
jgi:hypothetical protein